MRIRALILALALAAGLTTLPLEAAKKSPRAKHQPSAVRQAKTAKPKKFKVKKFKAPKQSKARRYKTPKARHV